MRPCYNHVMIDIETLGINPQSPIISIGACAFCIKTGQIGKTFEASVKWDIERFKPDVSTLQWWMKQSDAARALVLHENAEAIDNTLHAFNSFIGKLETTTAKPEYIWANSPAFDLVILRNAYRVCKINEPWKFWTERCVRTIRDHVVEEKRTQPRIAHSAIEDAIAQVMDVIQYYRTVGSTK